MKIYFDGAIYEMYPRRPGGISNFFDHLISLVSNRYPCLLTSSRPRELPHPAGPNLSIVRWNNRIRPQRLNAVLKKLQFYSSACLFRPSLVHPTYYAKPNIAVKHSPVVYTVYDMIHEKWRDQLDPAGRYAAEKKSCFEIASSLVCISESTRYDLLELYPHLEAKTFVIPLAGELKPDDRLSSVSFARKLDCSYILYVGARGSYKNFPRLVLAFSRVARQFSSLRFKVAGSPLSGAEVDLLDALDISHRVDVYPDATDSDLYSLYRSAIAFVYPSLHEGFGIPPLEAMALNSPVLAARCSSIPEVVGDAALMFNPWSVDSIAEAIVQIVSTPELQEELRRKGQRRCRNFTWQKTADQYLELYEKLVCG
jgi:glycosyltransferase involved in cell wall biosynthesis